LDLPESNNGPLRLFDYYHQAIFAYIGETYHDRISEALHGKPLAIRRKSFLEQLPIDQILSGEPGWDRCQQYLDQLEANIAAVLRRHSIFFWIHLYRRIGVQLSPLHEDKTDANTLGLVRGIVELAIIKYGDPNRADDVVPSGTVRLKDVLGGHYQRILRKTGTSAAEIAARFNALASSNQLVLTKFEQRDYFDIFLVEGLAYEYWRTTALMRAVGKGSAFRRGIGTAVEKIETPELTSLILSYDQRIGDMPFSTALIGSWFGPSFDRSSIGTRMVVPYYNVEQRDGFGPLRAFGFRAPPAATFTSNFLISFFDLARFRDAHQFLAEAFSKAIGTTLDAYLTCLWALSNIALLPARILFQVRSPGEDLSTPLGMNMMNIIQRGYTLFKNDSVGIVGEIMFRAEHFGCNFPDSAESDIAPAVEHLTLTPAKTTQIALWSGGRRFTLIPFGEFLVIDLQAVPAILTTLFYRVQHAQTRRDFVFEEAFRAALVTEGCEIPKMGDIYGPNGEHREIDASVRVGDCLILFECRSIERPLDYEIGWLQTLARRQELLEQKVEQALTLREFVLKFPVGRNYDFGWATTVSTFVVSPFIEWIWDRSARLWHNATTPRILQADEAITYLRELSKTLD
jgi:hypothetical protein